MKKSILVLLVIIAFSATPVFAKSDKANEHAQQNANTHSHLVVTTTPTPTNEPDVTPVVPSITITVTPKNEHTSTPSANNNAAVLGEKTNISNDVTPQPSGVCDPSSDYKNHGEYVSCVAHEHLGGQAVSAAARSDVGKKNVEVTTTPTPTQPISSPVTSAEASLHTFNPLQSLGGLLNRFFGFLKHFV